MTTEAPTADERAIMAETLGRIEGRYAWDHLDVELQRTFASRLADMLPGFDPVTRWESMSVRHRREWIFHERQTPSGARSVWVADEEQLRGQVDEATIEAFRSLIEQGEQ